jgi:hypothetical protein
MQHENQDRKAPPGHVPSELNNPNSEATRGGADAVNDTPGIAAHGTTPGYQFDVVKPQQEIRGGGKLVWLAAIVALGIILAYAAGMLR